MSRRYAGDTSPYAGEGNLSRDQWRAFLLVYGDQMATVQCLVCSEETMYAKNDGRGHTLKAPKTCGRLKCLVTTGEAEPVR